MIAIALAAFSCGPSEDRDLPTSYRDLAVPTGIVESPQARVRGEALFTAHCALCHGTRGDGHGQRSAALSTTPRNFTDPHWQMRASDRRIFHSIREGVPGTAMPAWKSLPVNKCWDLVAYVRSFGPGQSSIR
jgi:mono/diheme cytochrome c family protein